MKINSPWIFELDDQRKSQKINRDESVDVVIVGAGIAGVSTAFFLLENTDKKVILIDKYKLAHGATGHNAGYVMAYFERPMEEIVNEFGEKMAVEGQKALEDTWELIDHMYNKAGLSIPFTHLTGYAGYATKEEFLEELYSVELFNKYGLPTGEVFLAEETSWISEIPEKYKKFYSVVEKKKILELLESKDDQYNAASSYKVACTNSARFCEKVLEYLLKTYNARFTFYENTCIRKVLLKEKFALLDADIHTITAKRVVLCTNGFEQIEIFNNNLEIDSKFHKNLYGVIGYMSAYKDTSHTNPFAGIYVDKDRATNIDPYFYVSRRQYDFKDNSNSNLVSVGGPEIRLEDMKEYDREREYPEDAREQIDQFIQRTYSKKEEKEYEHHFSWHGLMGYTQNRIRLIGEEPKNKILLYNLGCNGCGVIPSIYGGWKIGEILAGKKLPPSVFDPK